MVKIEKICKFLDFCYKKFEGKDYHHKFIFHRAQAVFAYINSHVFTFNDYKLFCYYNYIFNDKMKTCLDIDTVNKIKGMRNIFSHLEVVEAEKFLYSLLGQHKKCLSLEDFFTINANGESLVYDYVTFKYITPGICSKYCYLFNNKRQYEETDKHRRFRSIIHCIKA